MSSSTQGIVVAGPRNGITAKKIEDLINSKKLTPVTKGGKSYSNKSKITIENFDFSSNDDGGKQLSVTDCQDVLIQNCKFRNKTTLGQGLNIVGGKTKRIVVQNCLFENFSFTSDNGGEPFRFGLSQYSGCLYDCVIRNCVFRNCKSDPEAVSLKASRCTVEDNFFINNLSNVTVRHGGLDVIQHNYFKGTNGVRVHGYGSKVLYNCFEDNNGAEDSFNPIVIRFGNKDKDPNYTAVDKPSGNEGSSHAIYAQAVNVEIKGNEFKNCKNTITELAKGATLKPKDIKKESNPTVKEFKFGIEVIPPSPPPTPPTPPTPVEPPVVVVPPPEPPVVVTPPTPPEEEEQPAVTPVTPDEPNDTHMCGIGRHEEARVHLHIYACPEHANSLRAKFKKMLEETQAETAATTTTATTPQ